MISDIEEIEMVANLRLGEVLTNLPELLAHRRAKGDFGPTYIILTCGCGERLRCSCDDGRFVGVWIDHLGRHVVTSSQPPPIGDEEVAALEAAGFARGSLPADGWRVQMDGSQGPIEAARAAALLLSVLFGARDEDPCDLEHWHDAGCL